MLKSQCDDLDNSTILADITKMLGSYSYINCCAMDTLWMYSHCSDLPPHFQES